MAAYLEILCSVAVVLVALYYYATSNFDFWKKRGVPGPTPLPFLGNSKDYMFAKVPVAQFVKNIYDEYKHEPMFGIYMLKSPLLLINDPELIKDVLIKDFSKFSNRFSNVHSRAEPLSEHLINLETERWRPLRSKLTPIFTTGKLKEMFHLIVECSQRLDKYLAKEVAKGVPLECRELTAKFGTDVIGSCAFGIDMNAMSNENSEFRRKGRDFFAVNYENLFRLKMSQFFPKLYDLLGFVIPDRKFAPFFTKVFMDTIQYREENNIFRPDFINTLMELKRNAGKMDKIELTDSLLTAQAFVFFAAGFETSSAAISNALYELAQNHDLQNKLREEIVEHCAKHEGELTWESVNGMKLLDKVFKETLRMYPSGGRLVRTSVSDYTFNGTKVTIPKDTTIWIPVFGLQRDPNIYPNPDVFDPERFSDEAVAARHPMYYLPFGDGPRNCIGARFAVYQIKVGLITILRKYKVDVCEKTVIPYEMDPRAFLLAPKGGIHLNFTKIEN